MFNLLLGALAALYPLAVFFGADIAGLHTLAGLLAAGLLLRLMFMPVPGWYKLLGVVLVTTIALLWLRSSDDRLLTLHPVILNVVLMLVFGISLLRGTPMIERIARIRNMAVGEHNRGYLRGLTAVWATFFAVASVMSAATVLYGNRHLWALWNGVLVYVGIAALTIGEWFYRRRFRARLEQRERAAANAGAGPPP